METDEVLHERVRASRVVRRIRHSQDRVVGALGESGCSAELRVLQFLGEKAQVVLPPCLVALEGPPQAGHCPAGLRGGGELLLGFGLSWHCWGLQSDRLGAASRARLENDAFAFANTVANLVVEVDPGVRVPEADGHAVPLLVPLAMREAQLTAD